MRKNLIVVVLALVATVVSARTPPGSDAQIAAAGAKIGAGDFAGAAAILEKVVAADPGNKLAWRQLGFAYLKQKKIPESRAAYEKLLAISPASDPAPQALYNIGVGYALEGKTDAAFEWLGKAKATGKLDMTQIQVDEDLKALSRDP